MDKLTPSAKLTVDALKTGPGNVHELSERTGRSRSTTDKALVELAKANLIVKVDDGGDSADGAPTRWQLANPADADSETSPSQPADGDPAAPPDGDAPATSDVDETDNTTRPAERGQAVPDGSPETAADARPGETGPEPESGVAEAGADAQSDDKATQHEEQQDGDAVETPKLCRGCQAQMPKICPDCWQKTPAYCGKCRRTMPQVRRGEPGEPVILSNGLPKLRPGELEAMVEKVIREHPLPAFAEVIGWTGGRLAIHLPGRSPGAITNALRKLARTGVAELIGDDPERYQFKPTEQPRRPPREPDRADTGDRDRSRPAGG